MRSRRLFVKNILCISPVIYIPDFIFGDFTQKLPNVLIIGDSISIGYTPFVKELLTNKANVYRPYLDNSNPENCRGTTYGIKNIDRWIGNMKWDVIHFNFGLHDLKHIDPLTGKNSNNPEHPHQASLKQYRDHLKVIVKKLKSAGDKLIFATTTPYPDKVSGPLRKPGMPEKYNEVAVKIMQQNDIVVNDLFAFVKPRMEELQRPNNVHFTTEGSKILGNVVVENIIAVLRETKQEN